MVILTTLTMTLTLNDPKCVINEISGIETCNNDLKIIEIGLLVQELCDFHFFHLFMLIRCLLCMLMRC